MPHHARFALPTEPLLDESTASLSTKRPTRAAARWLAELADEPDLVARARALWTDIGRRLDEPGIAELLEGALIHAALGRSDGIAVLAALLASQCSGDVLLQETREFRHLHRMALRLRMSLLRGQTLADREQRLLERLAALDGELNSDPSAILMDLDPSATVLDLGPAGNCRRAFGSLIRELETSGRLEATRLTEFLRLARLELDAAELRAAQLAGSIDPHAAEQLSHVMPILNGIDEDVRDLRAFLERLEHGQRPDLLHENVLLMREHLSPEQELRFMDRLESFPELQLVRRLLRGLDRSPLPTRTLGYFVDRLLSAGRRLRELKLRRREIDVLEAILMVLDFHRDGMLMIPAGQPVLDAIASQNLAGAQPLEGALRLNLDLGKTRCTPLPLGLPLPNPEGDEDSATSRRGNESVKRLLTMNINNAGTLLGLLRNPKIVAIPGAVALVAQRTRSPRVLEIITENRRLYSGQANRDVPLALLQSPLPLPIKNLRRFINVRYVSKIDLRRLAADRSAIRREVGEEITRYLRTLG